MIPEPRWSARAGTGEVERTVELDDVLTVFERELRGVAETVGGLARRLTGGRGRRLQRPDALRRLSGASDRIERLAAEARLLGAWASADAATTVRRWRLTDVRPLIETAIAGPTTMPLIANPPDAWDRGKVQATDDGALEQALRALGELARRECGTAAVCQVRWTGAECEVFFGLLSALVWDAEARRRPVPRDGGLRQLVISAVLAAHGATVWRAGAGRGVGVSLPLVWLPS